MPPPPSPTPLPPDDEARVAAAPPPWAAPEAAPTVPTEPPPPKKLPKRKERRSRLKTPPLGSVDDIDSFRIKRLEDDFGDVEDKVDLIDDKVDALGAAFGERLARIEVNQGAASKAQADREATRDAADIAQRTAVISALKWGFGSLILVIILSILIIGAIVGVKVRITDGTREISTQDPSATPADVAPPDDAVLEAPELDGAIVPDDAHDIEDLLHAEGAGPFLLPDGMFTAAGNP